MKRMFAAFAVCACLLLFPVALSGQELLCNFGLLKVNDSGQLMVTSTVAVQYTETKKETYQVKVPYTSKVKQMYTVEVPYTETVTEDGKTKTVTRIRKEERIRMVPVNRERTETRQRTVPVTKTRMEDQEKKLPVKTKIKTISGEEVDRAELKKSIGKGKLVLILKGNEKLTEIQKAVLKPDVLVLRSKSANP